MDEEKVESKAFTKEAETALDQFVFVQKLVMIGVPIVLLLGAILGFAIGWYVYEKNDTGVETQVEIPVVENLASPEEATVVDVLVGADDSTVSFSLFMAGYHESMEGDILLMNGDGTSSSYPLVLGETGVLTAVTQGENYSSATVILRLSNDLGEESLVLYRNFTSEENGASYDSVWDS